MCQGRWNGVYESINEGIWQSMGCPDPAKPLQHDVMQFNSKFSLDCLQSRHSETQRPSRSLLPFFKYGVFLRHKALRKQRTSALTVLEWPRTKHLWVERSREPVMPRPKVLPDICPKGLFVDLCAETSSYHCCFREISPKLGFYWILSSEGEETDVSSQLGKRQGCKSEGNYV